MARSSTYMAAPLVASALALLACGGKSIDGGAGDPNGGSGGSGFSGSGVGGSGVGGTSRGGSGTGGTGVAGASAAAGAPQCDALLDQSPWSLTVRLTNGTKTPIYLGSQTPGCGAGELFQVADAIGVTLLAAPYCEPSCQDLIKGPFKPCPAISCPIGSSITLQPGESTTQPWDGLYGATEKLPAVCAPAGSPTECRQVKHIEPGKFVFTAQAGMTLSCLNSFGMCGPCTPNGDSGCYTPGALVQGPFISTRLDVALGPVYGVGGAAGGMTADVNLVFKN